VSEGFFGRWSRRKQEAQAGQSQPETAPERGDGQALAPELLPELAVPAQAEPDQSVASAPLPTLEDVRTLTPDSDFQPFMRSGVGAEVRNAAMKKLFTDPHFNVMDGLDIYIDDYSQPDPMPAGMLRKMASAQFLKLVPEPTEQASERPAQDPDGRGPAGQVSQVVAQSPDSSAPAELPQHDHPDLQLQPDPAPADPSPGSRAR
jgi:hypothetical protein